MKRQHLTMQHTITEEVLLTQNLAQYLLKCSCELLQTSRYFLKLCVTPFYWSFFFFSFSVLKLCYCKGKAIFFLSCSMPQFIWFGFLKFGFQFIVVEQYIKSYIYKYIYYILYT